MTIDQNNPLIKRFNRERVASKASELRETMFDVLADIARAKGLPSGTTSVSTTLETKTQKLSVTLAGEPDYLKPQAYIMIAAIPEHELEDTDLNPVFIQLGDLPRDVSYSDAIAAEEILSDLRQKLYQGEIAPVHAI